MLAELNMDVSPFLSTATLRKSSCKESSNRTQPGKRFGSSVGSVTRFSRKFLNELQYSYLVPLPTADIKTRLVLSLSLFSYHDLTNRTCTTCAEFQPFDFGVPTAGMGLCYCHWPVQPSVLHSSGPHAKHFREELHFFECNMTYAKNRSTYAKNTKLPEIEPCVETEKERTQTFLTRLYTSKCINILQFIPENLFLSVFVWVPKTASTVRAFPDEEQLIVDNTARFISVIGRRVCPPVPRAHFSLPNAITKIKNAMSWSRTNKNNIVWSMRVMRASLSAQLWRIQIPESV